ncbi:MAG: prepilin-type N-terminal cleavage/methylation domain-containing protein [Delftia acidovorans]|jgi:general secretion pathway protein J|uniref:prepilin-type N-terminal cleavage/methylation domain-containing protein n=1 Tax=Delftia acidovorans TaxID=80866 RepID=UPI002833E920|nr:prepilin-type N-terminal cleavage/methylation domain-containing protein [Delftia acidovorans]MDR3014128.1 prepilin-type N-terminal cleavage/methylation domain-containing protein [Delftia acidovorans]
MSRHSRLPAGQGGFTLVELLVVMALLSLLMLGLASAMSTVSQTQERVDARLDRMDHQRVSVAFLRSVLGQASAIRRQAGLRKQGESELFFEGGPQGMRWLGIMPARFGMGGRTHFQLSVEGDALVLRFAPWQGPDVMPDWGQSQSYVIDRGVTAFALRYQNAKLGVAHWQPQWGPEKDNEKELPSAVQIELQAASGAWPMMVIAMRTPVGSNPRSVLMPSFGGGQQ